jgi:hypothetical protein
MELDASGRKFDSPLELIYVFRMAHLESVQQRQEILAYITDPEISLLPDCSESWTWTLAVVDRIVEESNCNPANLLVHVEHFYQRGKTFASISDLVDAIHTAEERSLQTKRRIWVKLTDEHSKILSDQVGSNTLRPLKHVTFNTLRSNTLRSNTLRSNTLRSTGYAQTRYANTSRSTGYAQHVTLKHDTLKNVTLAFVNHFLPCLCYETLTLYSFLCSVPYQGPGTAGANGANRPGPTLEPVTMGQVDKLVLKSTRNADSCLRHINELETAGATFQSVEALTGAIKVLAMDVMAGEGLKSGRRRGGFRGDGGDKGAARGNDHDDGDDSAFQKMVGSARVSALVTFMYVFCFCLAP